MFEKTKVFIKDVKAEIKKVVFPKRDELVGSTKVVIVAVFIVALFLGVVDFALSKFIKFILR